MPLKVIINKPKDVLLYQIQKINNFSVWAKKRILRNEDFPGVDGTVGAISVGDDENGWRAKSKKITKGERIDFLNCVLRFDGGHRGCLYYDLKAISHKTK
jgi:hypothetical protein